MPEPTARASLRPRRAQVRSDAGARLRSADGVLNVSPDSARRHRPRRRRPPRARRARRASAACASASRRWPGAATSTTTATPGRSCAAPTIRPSASCSTRFHILARKTDLKADPLDPAATASSWCRSPTRRSSTWTTCPGAATIRNFPGQGDLAGRSTSWRRCRPTGYRRAAVARDLQRPVPGRLGAQRRDRRPALADLSARRAARPHGRDARVGFRRCRRARPASASEFIEFAIDEDSAAALRDACCAASASRKAGVHKSKAVTRWRQGDINIVVNTEKEGFAHSFNITHGTVGLRHRRCRVDDAAATLDRAQTLLDQPFRQAVGPGELEIPAVRGVGGSLLYFIDPQERARPASGTSSSSRPARTPPGTAPASTTSTTSRSRCTTRRC